MVLLYKRCSLHSTYCIPISSLINTRYKFALICSSKCTHMNIQFIILNKTFALNIFIVAIRAGFLHATILNSTNMHPQPTMNNMNTSRLFILFSHQLYKSIQSFRIWTDINARHCKRKTMKNIHLKFSRTQIAVSDMTWLDLECIYVSLSM